MAKKDDDKPPDSNQSFSTNKSGLSSFNQNNKRKIRRWREWHERETPVKVIGKKTKKGVKIEIKSLPLSCQLELKYPNSFWKNYPLDNKIKLLDNITYIFTAHLPFLLKGNIRLEYNTGYPHVYSWSNQCFARYLPAYWYLYHGKRGTRVFPLLKTLLNSNVTFSKTKDTPPSFPDTIDENVIIPFTFGKDSFLTYHLAKELNLNPIIIWFNDPVDEGFEGKHKKKLFKKFTKLTNQKICYLDNPLGSLREKGEGWFGWELSITSWILLSLPFAYAKKAGYIIIGNEKSCNDFFYDQNGIKVVPDYEQSNQATEELSILTQSLSEGEVYTTAFLQGLHELAILAILKNRYFKNTFKFLMSCWSETNAGKNKRWCGSCSKCARIYLYLTANGINPITQAGFKDNMLQLKNKNLYNVFGQTASGTGWDAFGLNFSEQALAFYLTYLRNAKDPLVKEFIKSPSFQYAKSNFKNLINEYYSLHPETITPPQWKSKIDKIFKTSLKNARKEINSLIK